MAGPEQSGNPFPESVRSTSSQGGQTGNEGMMGTIKDRAQDLASAMSTTAEKAWDSTREGASQAWDTTRQQAGEMCSRASARTEEVIDSMTTFVKRHPISSLLFALGLGFVLAGAFGFMNEEPQGQRLRGNF